MRFDMAATVKNRLKAGAHDSPVSGNLAQGSTAAVHGVRQSVFKRHPGYCPRNTSEPASPNCGQEAENLAVARETFNCYGLTNKIAQHRR